MATRATKRARRANHARQTWKQAAAEDFARPARSRRVPEISVREQVKIRDGYLCRYCGEPGSTLDHVTPKCRGGRNTLDNLVWCCVRCNRLKADLSVESFLVLLSNELTSAGSAPSVAPGSGSTAPGRSAAE